MEVQVSVVLALFSGVFALHNGLGLTPQMGYSSFNDQGCEVTEAHVRTAAEGLIRNGLAQKGYILVNIDEGWLKGRDPVTHEIYEDRRMFPSGMKAMGDFVTPPFLLGHCGTLSHGQVHNLHVPGKGNVMKYGLYTSRGTCQCSEPPYRARCDPSPRSKPACEGSYGFEKQDAAWMVDRGMDYLKEDSCCGSQDPPTAYADYMRMQVALNATGKTVFFSLCGGQPWYAPMGQALGNSWRISGDGRNWGPLTLAINRNAFLGKYAGPGGWNDPDLLIGPTETVGGVTHRQMRSQFSMWAVMAAPLIIAYNVGGNNLTIPGPDGFSPLDVWGNEEVIEVNQDPLGVQGSRVSGGNLTFPMQSCGSDGQLCTNVWSRPMRDGSRAVVFLNNGPSDVDVACNDTCFRLAGLVPPLRVRDLWERAEVGEVHDTSFVSKGVPGQGGVHMYRFVPKSPLSS